MRLTKILVGSALAIPTVTIPLTTLSSCGSVWGYQTPYMVGNFDAINGPYKNFLNDETYLDADLKPIFGNGSTYLQSNYAIDVANSANYAYATPMKFVDASPEVLEEDGWKLSNSGWYVSSDAALASTATDKYKEEGVEKVKTVTNARNATLGANTDFVGLIGSTINTYLSLALQYQASQLKEDETDLQIAWGSNGQAHQFKLDHGKTGDKTDENNRKFFEQLFAFANLIGTNKVNALLRTSSVDFHFLKNPIPGYVNNEGTRAINNEFIQLLEGPSGSIGALNYYSSVTDSPDTEEEKYKDYTYKSVPVVISFDKLEQTYLNPTIKTKSFLVNDYYSTNDQITKSVGNAWKKNFVKFTGVEKDNAIPKYKTFALSPSESSVGITSNDQRLSLTSLNGGQFIALIDFAVRDYTEGTEKDTATLVKLDNVFPAYFLDILGNDAYKPAREGEASENIPTIINTDKVSELASTLMQLLRRESKEGQKPKASDLNDESKHLLAFLGYMFATSASTLKSENFLSAEEM
ncbi:MAG: hypothetical protein KBS35_02170 [Mycoplasma sp.]|nr:hypothetical protein [Candidatus Hennigella equi]